MKALCMSYVCYIYTRTILLHIYSTLLTCCESCMAYMLKRLLYLHYPKVIENCEPVFLNTEVNTRSLSALGQLFSCLVFSFFIVSCCFTRLLTPGLQNSSLRLSGCAHCIFCWFCITIAIVAHQIHAINKTKNDDKFAGYTFSSCPSEKKTYKAGVTLMQ